VFVAFAKNEAAVIDFLTDLWRRAAYGAVPPEPG
jgi:hypothetical protein